MLTSVLLIILAGLAFGLIHTALASMPVKNWARQRWGEARVDRWYRLFFSAAAGVTFLPVLVLPVLLPDRALYAVPTPWVWLTTALQVAALAVFLLALAQTDVARFVGLRQMLRGGEPIPADRHERLVTSGPYRWVRHPLYSTAIATFWLWPDITGWPFSPFAAPTFTWGPFPKSANWSRSLARRIAAGIAPNAALFQGCGRRWTNRPRCDTITQQCDISCATFGGG